MGSRQAHKAGGSKYHLTKLFSDRGGGEVNAVGGPGRREANYKVLSVSLFCCRRTRGCDFVL